MQLPLLDKGLDLLFYVVTISRVMTMVPVEVAIFVPRSPIGISLQLSGVSQGLLVFDLHQDLVYQDS